MASPSDLAGLRVLVTGASGFTGRYVTHELKTRGCHVVGMGGTERSVPRWAESLSALDSYHVADLSDQPALQTILAETQPDIVIHLAALAFVGHGKIDEFYQVNLVGTRNLLEAISESGVSPRRVLIASSANIYGNSSQGRLDEQVAPAPANDYAISKLGMEYVIRLWQERLPVTVVRPFNYTGIGQAQNFLIPKIAAHFSRRASNIELGNLDVARDFGDVRAVAAAYCALLENESAVGRTVNVCTGVAHSLHDVIDLCSEITGHTLTVSVNPAFARANEVKSLCGDNSLLHRLAPGWSAPPLRDTLEWMLSNDSLELDS